MSACEGALFFYRSPLQGIVTAVAFGWVMIRRDFSARDNPSALEANLARTARNLSINLKCATETRSMNENDFECLASTGINTPGTKLPKLIKPLSHVSSKCN